MSDFVFGHDCVILDACCVINLYATDRMGEILRAAPVKFTVSSYVQKVEARWVYDGEDADGNTLKQPIDFHPLVEGKLVEIVEPDLTVLSGQMILFAAHDIRNGEMISAAIAHQRNWAIGTDDASASKKLARLVPHLQIVSTFDLVKHWATSDGIDRDGIRAALRKIRERGKFSISEHHPLYEWSRNYG